MFIVFISMKNSQASQIIDLCIQLLSSKEKWKKEAIFKEECQISAPAHSLACALELMHLSVLGEYQSRNKLMRRVRTKIRKHFFFRQGWHPVNNFNNHRRTEYRDIIFLLNEVKESFRQT